MKKRIISIFMVVILSLSVVVLSTSANSSTPVTNFDEFMQAFDSGSTTIVIGGTVYIPNGILLNLSGRTIRRYNNFRGSMFVLQPGERLTGMAFLNYDGNNEFGGRLVTSYSDNANLGMANIRNHRAVENGSVIYVASGSMNISHGSFFYNFSVEGAIIAASEGSTVNVYDSSFLNNVGAIGGVFQNRGVLNIRSTSFSSNVAQVRGGVIANLGGTVYAYNGVSFSQDVARYEASTIFNTGKIVLDFSGCIFGTDIYGFFYDGANDRFARDSIHPFTETQYNRGSIVFINHIDMYYGAMGRLPDPLQPPEPIPTPTPQPTPEPTPTPTPQPTPIPTPEPTPTPTPSPTPSPSPTPIPTPCECPSNEECTVCECDYADDCYEPAIPVTFTISFNANGGSVYPISVATTESGTLEILPVPLRHNHIFNGWFTAGGQQITLNTVFTEDTVVFAQWTWIGTIWTPPPLPPPSSPRENAQITLTHAEFDKYIGGNITVTLHRGGFTLREVHLANIALVRNRDYRVNGNRITINESFLKSLDSGNREITFVMSGGINPHLQIYVADTTPELVLLPDAWVEPSEALLYELHGLLGNSFDSLEIIVQTSPADDIAGGYVTVDIVFTVGGKEVSGFMAYFTILVDLYGFTDDTQNHYRITAIHGDRVIGGNFDSDTGYFTVDLRDTGIFTIAYIETLNRLAMQLDSPIIYDLAGNAPTQIMDVLPVIQDNRTLIPIRFIAEALGAEVGWMPTTDDRPPTVHITIDSETLSFRIGEITHELAALGMDVPAQIMDNRTMVPLRFVSEFFGAMVKWDGENRSIEIIRDSAYSKNTI